MKAWIKAARLRTLPLAVSGIMTGAFLGHYFTGNLPWHTCLLLLATALLLQILSNFANDYGDFVKGTDNAQRIGPERALQSGAISVESMKMALIFTSILTFGTGITLVFTSAGAKDAWILIGFILAGILAIAAAIKYTIGKTAYGYKGLGDVFVFLFFGPVSVYGSYFLVSGIHYKPVLWPAVSIGLFSTAVLNMNNMRDVENDILSGKMTIPARISLTAGKIYHSFLVITGMISALWFVVTFTEKPSNGWVMLAYLPFLVHIAAVWGIHDRRKFDPQLKIVVLCTLISTIGLITYLEL